MPASARAFLVQDFSEGEISYKARKSFALQNSSSARRQLLQAIIFLCRRDTSLQAQLVFTL